MTELQCVKESKLEPTPTISYNNLASSDIDGVSAYAHDEHVVVLRALGSARLTQSEAFKATVTSLTFIAARGRSLLCFTNRFGMCAFDVARDAAILRISSDGANEYRGIAATEVEDGVVVVLGSTQGTLFFYTLDSDFQVQRTAKMQQHSAPVTCVACLQHSSSAGTGSVVSVDTDGKIAVSSGTGVLLSHTTFPNDCATSVAWLDAARVAVTFGSGAIRVLDVNSCAQTIAIGAHSRSITAMTAHQPSGRVATGGEDGLLCVWHIAQDSAKLLWYKAHTDYLLTGCAFNTDGARLNVVAYDSDKAWSYDVTI
jgi:WD40 repeat protein